MKTCLIVDDSRVIRKVARQILETLGYTCTEAENGKTAMDACINSLPDLVLLDWNMPVMDGYEFLVELRKMHEGNKPAVVFCTTENNIERIKKAMSGGANEYVMKPFDLDIIKSKLEQLGLL
ncbi:MAG: response regulator [Alphaproteobacteria bacterium]|nr:response regulator [Alphaproteobacteria bacterium]MCL2505002.1 response regulator [Alphaproteobacteria bacterium]